MTRKDSKTFPTMGPKQLQAKTFGQIHSQFLPGDLSGVTSAVSILVEHARIIRMEVVMSKDTAHCPIPILFRLLEVFFDETHYLGASPVNLLFGRNKHLPIICPIGRYHVPCYKFRIPACENTCIVVSRRPTNVERSDWLSL